MSGAGVTPWGQPGVGAVVGNTEGRARARLAAAVPGTLQVHGASGRACGPGPRSFPTPGNRWCWRTEGEPGSAALGAAGTLANEDAGGGRGVAAPAR